MSRSGKAKKVRQRDLVKSPARTWTLPIVFFAIGSVALGIGLQRSRQPRPLDPVVPEDISAFDKTLAARIQLAADEIRKFPSSAESHAQLGYLYEAHNYNDLAAAAYRNASQLEPKNSRWFYLWGSTLAKEKPSETAIEALTKSISLDPSYACAYERLGTVLMDQGKLSEATSHFQRALNLTLQRPEGYIHLAGARIESKQYDDAVGLLLKALSLQPPRSEAYYMLGRAYRALGKHAEADLALSRSRGADATWLPDPWRAPIDQARATHGALFLKADELLDAGKLPEAIVVLEQLVRDAPDNPDYINNLATAYLETGRPDESIRILERATQYRPDFFPIRINLASAWMAKGNLEKALEQAELATKLAPHVGRSYYVKGIVLARSGRFQESLATLIEAKKTEIDNYNVRGALGEVYAQLQQWNAAIEEFEAAVRLNPRQALIRYNLAMVYSKTERLTDAVMQLEEAARLDPGNQRVIQSLERARAKLEGQ